MDRGKSNLWNAAYDKTQVKFTIADADRMKRLVQVGDKYIIHVAGTDDPLDGAKEKKRKVVATVIEKYPHIVRMTYSAPRNNGKVYTCAQYNELMVFAKKVKQ